MLTYFKAMMVDYMAMTWMVMNMILAKVTKATLGTGSTQQGMILQTVLQSLLIRQNEVSNKQKLKISCKTKIIKMN